MTTSQPPAMDRAEAAKAVDLARRLLDAFEEIKRLVSPPLTEGWLERVEELLTAAKAAIEEVAPHPFRHEADTGFSREWARMLMERDTDMLGCFCIQANLYALRGGDTPLPDPDARAVLTTAAISVNDLLSAARLTLSYRLPRYADDDGNADPAVGA